MPDSAENAGCNSADSAGQPWAGRSFGPPSRFAGDSGEAPARLIEAVRRFRAGDVGAPEVLTVFLESRLLIPLVAEAGDRGVGPDGRVVDKTQELSIVSVAGPGGRTVLPVFSSVQAMAAWDAAARPIPAEGARVVAAAVHEESAAVVLDPGAETEFALLRPALWAVAEGRPWLPAYRDPEVLAEMVVSVENEPAVLEVQLSTADPLYRMQGAEVVVLLTLRPGLDRTQLDELIARLTARWAATPLIADRADALSLRLLSAPFPSI